GTGIGHRMNGTWRAQGFAAWAGRCLCLVAFASLLGSCSMYDDMFGSPTSSEKATSSQSYPNLGTVPNKAPTTSSPEQRQQISQGLVADQQNAAYSGQQLTAQPSGGSTPPPAPQPAPSAAEAASGTAAAPAPQTAPPLAAGTTGGTT